MEPVDLQRRIDQFDEDDWSGPAANVRTQNAVTICGTDGRDGQGIAAGAVNTELASVIVSFSRAGSIAPSVGVVVPDRRDSLTAAIFDTPVLVAANPRQ